MHIQTKIDLLCHVLSTAVCASIVYALYHEPLYVVVVTAGCIFIDLDHLADYFMFYKKGFRLNVFLRHSYLDGGKVYLFWHSWEIVILAGACAAAFHSRVLAILAVSLAVHLLIDNVQRRRPLFYFILYRMAKKFDAGYLLPEYFELKGERK